MLSTERDTQSVRQGMERWLGRPITAMTRPDPGWSSETVVIEQDLVVRLPPSGEGIFPVYDLEQQADVQQRVGAAGIPVAHPVRYEPDTSFLGAPFLAMPFVEGHIPAEFTASDSWLLSLSTDDVRHRLWRSLVSVLPRIHAVPSDGLRLRTGILEEIEFWDGYLAWACDGAPPPALATCLAWCRHHAPVHEPPPGLLWGDVRMGNVVFDTETLVPKAVLDWEMVSAGPAEMDVAWFLALEKLAFDISGLAVPGFGSRQEAVAMVEEQLERPLVDLEWFEVFALLRAGAVSTRIARLFERAGRPSMFTVGDDPASAAALALIDRL
jgi:aminoglycoside phosphotransferase (APT) family kinase protein